MNDPKLLLTMLAAIAVAAPGCMAASDGGPIPVDAGPPGPPGPTPGTPVADAGLTRPVDAGPSVGNPDASPAATPDAGHPAAQDAGAPDSGAALTGCAARRYKLCEDFESTDVGAIPNGWNVPPPTGWQNTAMVGVVAEAHSGAHGFKSSAATNGPRRILTSLGPLGITGSHWGRIFWKAGAPAPIAPSGTVIHSSLVALIGHSPVDSDGIEARVVDTVEDDQGKFQFLYNVQPNSRAEFATGSSYDWNYDAAWHCAEWQVDQATQSYRFFIDSQEVTEIAIDKGAGNYSGIEIPPAYDTLAIGWINYQNAPNGGFEAWFDDLAIDDTRIGCGP
jgi:hypothetical protein